MLRRREAAAPLQQDDDFSPGAALIHAARELRAHGHHKESLKMGERALQYYRERVTGNAPTDALRVSLAAALMLAEQWHEAHATWSGVVRDTPEHLQRLGSLGVTSALAGKTTDARRIVTTLAGLTRPYLLGEHHYERARVLAALGDAEGAVAALQLAFRQGQFWEYGKIHRHLAFEPIRDYPPFLEFLKPRQ